MNKKIKVVSFILLTIFTLSLLAIGCQAPAEKPNQPNNDLYRNDNLNRNNDMNGNNGVDNNNYYNNNNDYYNNNNNNMNMNDMSRRAEKIADRVAAMTNVEDARVIITDRTALVGVDLEGTGTTRLTDDLRRQIERTVKNADNRIDRVSVTVDPDIFGRLDRLGRSIREGEPITRFNNDIDDIIRRIDANL